VNAALLVYDISNRRSFDELDFWHREILRCSASDARAPLLMLIGNKKDQEEEGKREVTEAEGRQKG
jgi:GTPase SAR1 family protein